MEFWRLVSIFRQQSGCLEELLREPTWSLYRDWYEHFASHVQAQNRSVLDAPVPEALWRKALALSRTRFCVGDGLLRRLAPGTVLPSDAEPLTALEAFERFGAAPLEEAEEYGSARVA
jgi:hypothetical protein